MPHGLSWTGHIEKPFFQWYAGDHGIADNEAGALAPIKDVFHARSLERSDGSGADRATTR